MRALSSVEPVKAASMAEPAIVNGRGFSESLLHFGISDSPLSLVIGYGSAEPSHVKRELSDLAGYHSAEARPSLGLSVSF